MRPQVRVQFDLVRLVFVLQPLGCFESLSSSLKFKCTHSFDTSSPLSKLSARRFLLHWFPTTLQNEEEILTRYSYFQISLELLATTLHPSCAGPVFHAYVFVILMHEHPHFLTFFSIIHCACPFLQISSLNYKIP